MEILPTGHGEGGVFDLTTSFVNIDLSAYQRRYVKISVDADAWFTWLPANTATAVVTTAASALGAAVVADEIVVAENRSVQRVVTPEESFLRIAVKSGTGKVRIKPVSRKVKAGW